jgi:hypothetical protein
MKFNSFSQTAGLIAVCNRPSNTQIDLRPFPLSAPDIQLRPEQSKPVANRVILKQEAYS